MGQLQCCDSSSMPTRQHDEIETSRVDDEDGNDSFPPSDFSSSQIDEFNPGFYAVPEAPIVASHRVHDDEPHGLGQDDAIDCSASERRLRRELSELECNEDGIGIQTASFSRAEWLLQLNGAPGTIYDGEEFVLRFRFTDDYPMDSPEVPFESLAVIRCVLVRSLTTFAVVV